MDFDTLTLASAARALQARELSARELTDSVLARISARNPALNAFITVTTTRAQAAAARADEERARGLQRGPLQGIPLALKDLFDVADAPTTGGSRILRQRVPHEDAFAVARLVEAGAVIVGKTNLHEWAYGVTNDNPHFGRTLNPWNAAHSPGGSSGGSATAVSARLCLGALGTDTGGSIRIPSALCGVTGLKPTFGRVSLRGVIPLSPFMDHAGPIAQTAEDCALFLRSIAGYDPLDPATVDVQVPDYRAALDRPLDGVRLAVPGGYFEAGVDPEILSAVERAGQTLERVGARLVRKPIPFAEEMFLVNRSLLSAEAYAMHRERLERQPGDFGADVVKRLERGAAISAAEYVEARRRQMSLTRLLDLYFADVDALLIPSTRSAAPAWTDDPVVSAAQLTAFTGPFNLTGFPALSAPCGFTQAGLPIGLQLVTRRWDEATALRIAHRYQLGTDWHQCRPPLQ